MRKLFAAVTLLATLGAGSAPPWLRPPAHWVALDQPPSYGHERTLAMWREPAPRGQAQNISLAIQPFGQSIEAYAMETGRTLHLGPFKPTLYKDVPLPCNAGPARLLVYETRFFGEPQHFEQIMIKRGGDVYIATYTRGIKQPQSRAAAAALRAICR